MPEQSRDNQEWDTALAVNCATCGEIAITIASDLERAVRAHFTRRHPNKRSIAEGVDFTVYESPNRCDTCLAVVELPYWTHVSTPPTSIPPMIDEDGLWLTCDTCHKLWQARDLEGWLEHYWTMLRHTSPGIAGIPAAQPLIADGIAMRMKLLFQRWDEGTRTTTAD